MSISTRLVAPLKLLAPLAVALLSAAPPVWAHFQMIIPSDDMVTTSEPRTLELDVMFWHPFENQGMPMVEPARFGVVADGKDQSLLDQLRPVKMADATGQRRDAFKLSYPLRRPGDYIFYIEPKPYWEPSEESFIVHYTKVVVNAFGLEAGWDAELGLKTEIVPLTRPYGLWANNVFQGIVKVNGKAVPFSTVEVEYYNPDGAVKASAPPMITQVVKADPNGVFTYAMPRAGWWGFAALNTDKQTMRHEGKDYPVEIGALIWVHTQPLE